MKIKHRLRQTPMRAILSEFLPYELPTGFSNVGYYKFLLDQGARFKGDKLTFRKDTPEIRAILKLLFNAQVDRAPTGSKHEIEMRISSLVGKTVPLRYRTSHEKHGYRELGIPHPRAQLALAHFYEENHVLVTYFASQSNFSIRTPREEAKVTVSRSDVLRKRVDRNRSVENSRNASTTLRSYFRYHKYSNINEFFDSHDYRAAEKKYPNLLRLDVSKCFDSIYTHTIEWSIYGRENVKSNRDAFKRSFAHDFDSRIRAMNEDHTSGILIGPEVSRIFAELILQRVDRNIAEQLESHDLYFGEEYAAFRYVDDFFFFHSMGDHAGIIQKVAESALRVYHLSLQAEKIEAHSTPHLPLIGVAKSQVRNYTRDMITPRNPANEAEAFGVQISASKLVEAYKSTLAQTQVSPPALANYCLVQLEESLEEMIANHPSTHATEIDLAALDRQIARAFVELTEYAAYVYSGSGQASPSIKTARIFGLISRASGLMIDSPDRRDLVTQKLFSELSLLVARFPMSQFATVEGLFLLDALQELGSDYRINSGQLRRFAGISAKKGGTEVSFPPWFNGLIGLAMLQFMGDDNQYISLRNSLQGWLLNHLGELQSESTPHAELPILALDLITCPFVSKEFKASVLSVCGVKNIGAARLEEFCQVWFTRWDRQTLHEELLQKRAQEVY